MKKDSISTIRFKTLNCGGISGQTKAGLAKRRGIFNSIKHNNDIVILTETKFKNCDLDIYRQECNCEVLASCTPEPRAQAGVALLFRKGLAYSIKREGKDKRGRVVWALVEINTKLILVIGVYAPAQGDDPCFFSESVFPVLDEVEYDHVVLGGDWNLGMDTDLDYMGYQSADSVRPKSRHEIHKQIEKYDLLDIYRELHTSGSEKTWRLWNKSRRKADKEARLDYFLVDTSLASYVELVGVSAPFTASFDHRPVILKIDFNKVTRGPGYWKFNNSMLNDNDFREKVDEQIAWVLHEYQLPETPETEPHTLRAILFMNPTQQANIKLSINPHQFLEYLLFSIKGVARRHGQQKKASLITRKERTEELIRQETQVHDALLSQVRAGQKTAEPAFRKTKRELEVMQKELNDIDTHLCEGAYIRSGANWKCESEAPTKIFLQLEKWSGQQRFIGIVEVEGDEPGTTRQIIHQPEIENEVRSFYENLYKARPTESSDSDLKGFMGDEGYQRFHNIAQRNVSKYTYDSMDENISSDEVLAAISHGKHGVAPGISGFSREFYQSFSKELIGFIMNYIQFTEQIGILSENQRIGVITLLPKGQKDKKTLKNWRPITLLSTLYKIISGVIGNRFKKFLPQVIDLGQKGFVDGRYMGEVTRLLYDTIHDAYSTKGKKGIIMSIDFEKAFDSVSFTFIEKVIETAGFPKKMAKWVKILLRDFKSHINHAGNLLKLIHLGRGARQGDPIASILFVLAIEVLLIAIRSNPRIEPYKYELNVLDKIISQKVEAYADDVNIIMPRSEQSIREVIATLDRFEKIAGLKVNKDKTQMLRIGKGAASDPVLCNELELKWVTRLKILGIYLSATPSEINENFEDKIKEIESLLNRWTFRNMTVYGRIRVVKSLALSKITHLVQIIPNPPAPMILQLQRIINNFVWKGSKQKKVVINKDKAELPENKGGLAVPNLQIFWDALKLAWLPRLLQTDDNTTWKRLAMSKLSHALKIPGLTVTRLLQEGPESIAKAASSISNPFWQAVLKRLPQLERTFYNNSLKCVGERVIWDNLDFQTDGKPLKRNFNNRIFTRSFNLISDFISPETKVLMSEEEVKALLGERLIPGWNRVVGSLTTYLTSKDLTWHSVDQSETGPKHLGWSRMVSECFKAKKFYSLLMTRPPDYPRNSSEKTWLNAGLTTYNQKRWDSLYRNQAKLRCGLRVKYEEFRILWGRQELNHYKSRYASLQGGNSTACSYCNQDIETEMHLYVDCLITQYFWVAARRWFNNYIGVAPTIVLKGPRLFGLEKEPPNDLSNIFYRSARYCIYTNRKKTAIPSVQCMTSLVKDELKLKYSGKKILAFTERKEEQKAIWWLNEQMGWSLRRPPAEAFDHQ